MFLQTLTNALYSPSVWQNRLVDELGLAIILVAVVAVAIHFIVRHIRPPVKEEH